MKFALGMLIIVALYNVLIMVAMQLALYIWPDGPTIWVVPYAGFFGWLFVVIPMGVMRLLND